MTEIEDWQLDFEWLRIRTEAQQMLGLDKLPDFQGMLSLIGVQELGVLRDDFTKEEKQDLMHIAVCRLLSYDGYFELEGYDTDGWPHWRALIPVPDRGVKSQENLLKKKMIQYFEYLKNEPVSD